MKKRSRPLYIVYLFFASLLKLFSLFCRQKFEHKIRIKGPAIILGNHTTWLDFAYTMSAMYPYRVRFLAAEKMFKDPFMGFFLRLSKAIPKKLYRSDTRSVIEMLKELKNGGVVSLFPEGQISITGRSLEPGSAIVKLLRRANVDIYLVKHKNANFVVPSWTGNRFAGRFYTEMKMIISAKQQTVFSDEEMLAIIRNELFFDPYEYNKSMQLKYKGKSINGLENVVVFCPKCGHNELHTLKTSLICNKCAYEMKYDEYGYLAGRSLVDIYLEQKEYYHKLYNENYSFKMENEVILEGYIEKEIKEIGKGILSLSKEGYRYKGTYRGGDVDFFFPLAQISSTPSDLGKNIQIYDNNDFYQFRFNKNYLPIQYVLFGEALRDDINAHGTLRK